MDAQGPEGSESVTGRWEAAGHFMGGGPPGRMMRVRRRKAVWLIFGVIIAALATSVSFAATSATATISVSEVSSE